MGTNFYLNFSNRLKNELDIESLHIGKRSAAGRYCWDCGHTLCKGGNKQIHHDCGNPEHRGRIACDCNWHKSCPTCGKKLRNESLSNSTAGRELGFNKNKPKKKTGVSSCCSFTWAMELSEVKDYCKDRNFLDKLTDKPIRDEYGTQYTLKEFMKVLEECPVQYKHIGEHFS